MGARLTTDSPDLSAIAQGAPTPPPAESPASAAAYRSLIEALGVAVYVTDAEGRIQLYNEAAANLWGRHPRVGTDLWCGSWKLLFPDGSPMAHDECPMAVSMRERRAVRGGEAIAERPDGTRVPFMAFPTPLLDGNGALKGAVNVLIDISARTAAEARMQEQQEELARALMVKDEFLGMVSHELRTPITMILGNAYVLDKRRGSLTDEAEQTATSDILREAQRLQRIVDDLLTLARMEQQKLEFEPVALARLVEATLREYPGRPAQYTAVDGASEAIVFGDEALMVQVLRNYLNNAEKYGGTGAATEVIVERDVHEATVRVLDRGRGISPEEAELLFEPFYRAAVPGGAGGLGIGLSVCRRLIEAMGGRVWAAPRDGGGSEFGFAVALCDLEEDA